MPRNIGKNSTVSFSRRFMSFLLDLSLSYALYFYGLSFSIFIENATHLLRSLGVRDFLFFDQASLTNLFLFFLIFILFRVVFTLILASSLGQIILGITSAEQSYWARVGGAGRVVIEGLFFPLKIFDFPIYRGKASFFETITLTKLKATHNIFVLPMYIVSFLLILILFIYSPILQNLTILDGINIRFNKKVNGPLKRGESFKDYKNFSSIKYKFTVLSKLGDSDLNFVPSYEVIKTSKGLRITPYMTVHGQFLNSNADFKFKRNLNLAKFIQKAKDGNPLFFIFYPQLNYLLKNLDAYEKSSYRPEFGDDKLLNPLQQREIKDLIESSFSMKVSGLHKSFFKHGPFISGHLNFRSSFMSFLEEGSPPEVDIIMLGNHNFLRLKQKLDHFSVEGRKKIDLYIPIDTINSAIYSYAYDDNLESHKLREKFLKGFLFQAKWFFDYEDNLSLPKNPSNMTAFHVIDFFTSKKINDMAKSELEVYIYNYFYDLAKKSLLDEDKNLTSLLLTSLDRILLLTKYQNKNDKKEDSVIFLEQIQGLVMALKKSNLEYFGE